jgi:hypothetical protein
MADMICRKVYELLMSIAIYIYVRKLNPVFFLDQRRP